MRKTFRGYPADGTPDDYVISILSHRFDEGYVAGIVKPEETTWIGVFNVLPMYLRYYVKKPLITIGQEKESLNSSLGENQNKISKATRMINAREEYRLAIYTCKRQEGKSD
jgi:hypothetical protein